MKKENKQVEKLCSFYVSNWHLVTMILPYINNRIEQNAKIITILENDLEENIKTLVEKLNLSNKDEILNIGWKNNNLKKYSSTEELLKNEIDETKENLILINGSKNYIDKNNEIVKKVLKQNQKVKIINLFEVTEFNHNIVKILNSHDRVLNTSGEKEIFEVFEGYEKKNLKNA